jgi:hypothetical protein
LKIKCSHQIPNTCKKHPELNLLCDINGDIYGYKTGIKRKLNKRKDGYLQLSVRRSSYLAHRLIAQTHLQNKYNKPKINHKNGNKTDNRVENLEWCTQRENIIHSRDVLGSKYNIPGVNSFTSKFNETSRLAIINLYNMGFLIRAIAKIFGVANFTILRQLDEIRNNRH